MSVFFDENEVNKWYALRLKSDEGKSLKMAVVLQKNK
jgi:hypothetical protein